MHLGLRSIFETPPDRPALISGVQLGQGWHIGTEQNWSYAKRAELIISARVFPVPQPLLVQVQVFNATPDHPKQLRIGSRGHDPIVAEITTSGPVALLLHTPCHAPDNDHSPIWFDLDHLDSPFLVGSSIDERQLGFSIKKIISGVPELTFPMEFTELNAAALVLAEGWAPPEEGGAWSVGEHSILRLPNHLFSGKAAELIAQGSVLPRPADQAPLEIDLYEAGRQLAAWRFLPGDAKPLRCPLPKVENGIDRKIELIIRNIRSPISLGVNADDRMLGLQLKQLSLAPKSKDGKRSTPRFRFFCNE